MTVRALFSGSLLLVSSSVSLALTNGVPVSEGESPSIVFLELDSGAICTGVGVGEDVVLTAVHCVGAHDPARLRVNSRKVLEIKVPTLSEREVNLDLALLRVEPGTVTAVSPVLNDLPELPRDVELYGYGGRYSDRDPVEVDEAVVRRRGWNRLEKRSVNSTYLNIRFEMDAPYDPKQPSGALPGDSGGPMVLGGNGGGAVIGIASKSLLGTSNYINLTGAEARSFLLAARKQGWPIRFAEGPKR